MRSPGIVKKHEKPRICLKTGISSKMAISAATIRTIRVISHFLKVIISDYDLPLSFVCVSKIFSMLSATKFAKYRAPGLVRCT